LINLTDTILDIDQKTALKNSSNTYLNIDNYGIIYIEREMITTALSIKGYKND